MFQGRDLDLTDGASDIRATDPTTQAYRKDTIVLGSRVSRMPRHPSKDIKKGTLEAILSDLGLKM